MGPRPLAYSQPTAAVSCLLLTLAGVLVLRSEQARNLGCARGDDRGFTPSSQHRGTQKQRLCAWRSFLAGSAISRNPSAEVLAAAEFRPGSAEVLAITHATPTQPALGFPIPL